MGLVGLHDGYLRPNLEVGLIHEDGLIFFFLHTPINFVYALAV